MASLENAEPALFTILTDWMLAVFSIIFGFRLLKESNPDLIQKFWAIFFFLLGVASIFGGIGHGFVFYVGPACNLTAWTLSGIGVFCAEMAALQLIENSKFRSSSRFFVYSQLLVMLVSVFYFQNFQTVLFNSIVGLLVVAMPLNFFHYNKHKDSRSLLVTLGIISNIVPALIHAFKISINEWFNANDISHVVMIFCFYLLFKGAKDQSFVRSSQDLVKI
jgi:hypothetical protein